MDSSAELLGFWPSERAASVSDAFMWEALAVLLDISVAGGAGCAVSAVRAIQTAISPMPRCAQA